MSPGYYPWLLVLVITPGCPPAGPTAAEWSRLVGSVEDVLCVQSVTGCLSVCLSVCVCVCVCVFVIINLHANVSTCGSPIPSPL